MTSNEEDRATVPSDPDNAFPIANDDWNAETFASTIRNQNDIVIWFNYITRMREYKNSLVYQINSQSDVFNVDLDRLQQTIQQQAKDFKVVEKQYNDQLITLSQVNIALSDERKAHALTQGDLNDAKKLPPASAVPVASVLPAISERRSQKLSDVDD